MNAHCLESDSPPSREPGALLLETERLIMRRPLATDAAALAAVASFPEVAGKMSDRFRYPYTLKDAEDFINGLASKSEDGGPRGCYPHSCLIFIKPNSRDNPATEPLLIGSLGCHAGEDIHYVQWSLGYFLTPSAWGKGYATEAFGGFIRWAFDTWPRLNRFEAETYASNIASASVLRKLGFTQEGVRRGCVEKNGVVMDVIVFGLVRSDGQV